MFNPLVSRSYLPHIDGLRFVAVIPVLIFHYFSSWCPAGFLGVDIFFVISGYLICGGIFKDLEEGRFSIASFYHRRIRRIFPAYFVLVVATLFAGVALYHWARVIPLAQTALFSTLFSTNLYFWLDMGYFQPNAHENPLLNLWSLGVEEHFYIMVPVATWLLWLKARNHVRKLYLAALLASLMFCILLGNKGQSTTSFYILPARAWELLAGALIAAIPPSQGSRWGKPASFAGLALIVLSFWCLSTEHTAGSGGTSVELLVPFVGSLGVHPFPGWVTIPVVVGSMLLIYYGAMGPVSKLLTSGPCVGIGKISYSLYLWHWPILVFTNYIFYGSVPMLAMSAAVILSFVTAYLSWRWVELPVRLNKDFTPRKAFAFAGLGCVLLTVACGLLITTSGLRNAVHVNANHLASAPRPFLPNLKKFVPQRAFSPPPYPEIDAKYVVRIGADGKPPTFCLIGDSHAQALAPGLDKVAAEHGRAGFYITRFVHLGNDSAIERILEWVAQHPDIKDVYLVGRWLTQYGIDDGLPGLDAYGKVPEVRVKADKFDEMQRQFRQTAEWFSGKGKQVFFFSSVPEYANSPNDIAARSLIIPTRHIVEITPRDYVNRQRPVTGIFETLRDTGVKIVPLESGFIRKGRVEYMSSDGSPYYMDSNHLNEAGAYHAVQSIAHLLWPTPSSS